MSRARTFAVVAIILLLLFFGGAAMVGVVVWSLVKDEAPGLDEGTVLIADLRRELPEYAEETISSLLGNRRAVNLTEAVRLLQEAAGDERIDRIVVRLGGIAGVGWGAADEIRTALFESRHGGKQVDIHIDATGDLPYYIATAGTRIHLAPGGMLFVDGLYAEIQLLKNMFGKVDVEWDAVTAGEYKSFPEPYTRDSISDELREQIDQLLDTRFEAYIEAIALGRTLTPKSARNAIDDGPYLVPHRAVEAGLADTLTFWSDFARSAGIDDEGSVASVSLEEYRDAGVLDAGGPNIAVVLVVGDIMPGPSREGFGELVAGSETIVEALDQAADNENIDAIVLRISSPGGSVAASDDIWNAVERAKTTKPVIASMGDIAASGGYWIAAGADAIVADPTTITGSIGVFVLRPSWAGLYRKIGIGVEEFSRGENAEIFYSSKPWSDDHKKRIERGIDHSYEDFLARVGAGRDMDRDEVESIAGGRVWPGRLAHEIGLVDALGGIGTAVAVAKEHAGIDQEEGVNLVYYPEEKGFFERLRAGDFDMASQVRREAADLVADYRLPRDLLPHRAEEAGLFARQPFRLIEN